MKNTFLFTAFALVVGYALADSGCGSKSSSPTDAATDGHVTVVNDALPADSKGNDALPADGMQRDSMGDTGIQDSSSDATLPPCGYTGNGMDKYIACCPTGENCANTITPMYPQFTEFCDCAAAPPMSGWTTCYEVFTADVPSKCNP